MATPEAERFWAFSLSFYDAPEVQAACLALQDREGVDVNVLLYLLFRAADGQALPPEAIAALDTSVADWRREVVRPLRALRRILKEKEFGVDPEGRTALRNGIKRSELQSEKLQQFHIAALAPDGRPAPPEQAAEHNLRAYATYRGIAGDPVEFDTMRQRFDHVRGGS